VSPWACSSGNDPRAARERQAWGRVAAGGGGVRAPSTPRTDTREFRRGRGIMPEGLARSKVDGRGRSVTSPAAKQPVGYASAEDRRDISRSRRSATDAVRHFRLQNGRPGTGCCGEACGLLVSSKVLFRRSNHTGVKRSRIGCGREATLPRRGPAKSLPLPANRSRPNRVSCRRTAGQDLER